MRFAHIAAILICASAVAGEPPALKFNGLYCADDVDGFIPPVASYLRFYSDGAVVSTAARDTPEEAAKWIRRNDSTSSQGKYILEGRTLRFTVTNINGAVDYSGTIDGDRLVLSWDARNEKKGKEVYMFVPLPLPTQ
jgi:hypothetical protein